MIAVPAKVVLILYMCATSSPQIGDAYGAAVLTTFGRFLIVARVLLSKVKFVLACFHQ